MFFLRKSNPQPEAAPEPAPLSPEPEAEPPYAETAYQADPSFRSLAVSPFGDETPDGLPGVPDLYAIIGVEPLASDEMIRYAYRRKAARLHERRWRPGQAVRQLAELNAAYEILGKPDRRADYDRRRARQAIFEQRLNGSVGQPTGRGLPSGQRHRRRRLRLNAAGGLIEVLVIVTAIVLAVYVAATVLSTRSLIDLSKIVEIGETLGVAPKRRANGTLGPATTPTSATPEATPAAAGGGPSGIAVAAGLAVIALVDGEQVQLQTSFTPR